MEALAPFNPDEGQANPISSLADSARAQMDSWFGIKPSASSSQMQMTSASDDPRWDEERFNAFSAMHAPFVSLAYVKGIKDGSMSCVEFDACGVSVNRRRPRFIKCVNILHTGQ